MMGFGGLGLIFLVAAAFFIFKLFPNQNNNSRGNYYAGRETPLDILKKRFASGEISREEYEEKKRNII